MEPDEELLAFLQTKLHLESPIINLMTDCGIYTLESFIDFAIQPYDAILADMDFQDLTRARGDFMIVLAFGKYVEEKLTRDGNDPRNVNLTTFDPGPFQAFVKKTLHTIRQEIQEECKLYQAWAIGESALPDCVANEAPSAHSC
jgi:hypothetical protein